jgi:hypothetical protein
MSPVLSAGLELFGIPTVYSGEGLLLLIGHSWDDIPTAVSMVGWGGGRAGGRGVEREWGI